MTLIIAAGNTDQFIQVSDRRLSSNRGVEDDESNKAIIFNCGNARMSVGFTGLATAGTFSTRKWLLATLNECAAPDYIADQIIKRFTDRATEDFRNIAQLKALPSSQKRLSIMFTGYLYHHEPPLGALAIVSNFQNIDTNITNTCASSKFECFFREEPRPNDGKIALFYSIGTLPPVPKKEFQKISDLVKKHKPAKAIVEKLVDVVRKLSENTASGNTIGKQINSIVLPRDRALGAKSGYHSDAVKMETYMPDEVMVISEKLHMNVSNIKAIPADTKTALPMSGPKLKPKQPCWCGSGKKYKKCHGKTPDKNQAIRLEFKPDD